MSEGQQTNPQRRARQARLAAADLYLVTCAELSDGRSDEAIVAAALAGGVRLVQLRDKRATRRELFAKAERLRALTAEHGALLIINDHVDIALAVGADGVHLGQSDFPVPAARRLLPEQLIGASTHSLADALRAQAEDADYVNLGPIFPTATKEHLTHFLGPVAIAQIAPHLHIPFTVMGGIKLSNIDQVVAAGARLVAVVTAVTQAADPTAAARALRARIAAGGLA
jgi:thiamine-phosphate pyrophosphorylase